MEIEARFQVRGSGEGPVRGADGGAEKTERIPVHTAARAKAGKPLSTHERQAFPSVLSRETKSSRHSSASSSVFVAAREEFEGGMGGHGTESLASCAAARASPAGLQRPARQKLYAESVTHMPSTSERTVELVQRRRKQQQQPQPQPGPVTLAMAPEFGFRALIPTEAEFREVLGLVNEEEVEEKKVVVKGFKVKVGNASLRRLISGAIAGAVSRTAVAPLETIRTHLMVGSGAEKSSVVGMFQTIMQRDGWQGLFRGNGVNVLRVAPSKAIEMFAYDSVKTFLAPKNGEPSRIPLPVPVSLVAGAAAGVSSTITMYPLELLKTRLTVEHGMYKNLLHALVKIVKEEGPMELYRGLLPSLIGVIPYAAINYCSYDTLRKTYRRVAKREDIGNLETLLMGSIAGALASTASFPLEVARKQMQVGNIGGRQVYNNVFHALSSIVKEQGPQGLYRGLGPSCIKIIPAAGISFMCYEACKRVLVEEQAKLDAEQEKEKEEENVERTKT